MRIKSIEIKDFKGTKSAVYDFNGNSAVITGSNGVGKTTIADAVFYVLADRDYLLTSNPEIYPIDQEESQPTVTIIAEIDGVDHELCKWQVRTKKEKNGVVEVSTKNEYSINSVPKSATTFKEYLEEKGVDLSKFLEYSHIEVFTQRLDNKKDRDGIRATLFEMANSKSDLEIAQETEGAEDVASLLSSYTMEEIEAMYKVQKKKAVENVASIPEQIVGLEKAKTESVDVAELNLQKVDLERQIKELESSKVASDVETKLAELKSEKASLLAKHTQVETEIKSAHEIKKSKAESDVNSIESEIRVAEKDLGWLKSCISGSEAQIKTSAEQRAEIGKEYESVKSLEFDESKWTYDENSEICPNCGQTYPKDRIEEIKNEFETKYIKAREDFNKDKQEKMESLFSQAELKKNQEAEWQKSLDENKAKLEKVEADYKALKDKLKSANDILSNIENEQVLVGNAELIGITKSIAELDGKIASVGASSNDTSDIDTKVAELKNQVSEIDKTIGAVNNNVRIDEQIIELRAEQVNAEQKKADAEKILYELSLVSMAKNEQLSAEINKHFKLVDFIFFDYQKNGEIKDVVIPTVDGKKLGQSMNTALEMLAKLDIINGLQDFFGADIPIFVDQAEKLDKKSLSVVSNDYKDRQIIFLKVADSDIKVEEI